MDDSSHCKLILPINDDSVQMGSKKSGTGGTTLFRGGTAGITPLMLRSSCGRELYILYSFFVNPFPFLASNVLR